MKRASFLAAAFALLFGLTAFAFADGDAEAAETAVAEPRAEAAVVYFSATGTTRRVAEMIAEQTGADLYEIVPETPYTDADLNYNDDNCRANKEQDDDTARPAIAGDLSAVTQYATVYLGHPIWWGTIPRIIETFLDTYDLGGAAVYTFCTSGGSSIDRALEDLRAAYPELNIVSGRRLNNATEADVSDWLAGLGK